MLLYLWGYDESVDLLDDLIQWPIGGYQNSYVLQRKLIIHYET